MLDTAISVCQNIDGRTARLPLPENLNENNDLRSATKVLGLNLGQIAIDLTDKSAEGTFVTSSGQLPTYTNWAKNEPNSMGGDEDYVVLWTDPKKSWTKPGFWNDAPANKVADVVCQLEFPPVLCSKPSAFTQNKVLASGLTICEDWKFSVDLKLPSQPTNKWLNVFGVQVATAKHGTYGARIPAILIKANEKDIYLHICNSMNNQPSVCYNTKAKWNTGNWINLKLSQTNGLYEIKVENVLVHKVVNKTPRKWNNVKIVAGNIYGRFGHYKPASGEYRNFKMNTCETAPIKKQSGTL